MTVTWGHLHPGDAVRGADQRAWFVVERRASRRWVVGGEEAEFALALGERRVTTRQRLDAPAPIVSRADHTATAGAWAALAGAGLNPQLIEETTMSEPQPAAPAAPEPKRDRWGRYILPHPDTGKEQAWTRATTIARTLADEYDLTQWKLRMVAKGMALRPDLVAGAAAADPDDDKGTLNSIVEQAMQRAGGSVGANLGTAFHTFARRLDRGEPLASLGAPAPIDADLKAYQDALAAARFEVVASYAERIVVVPELGIAGTLDRIVAFRKTRSAKTSAAEPELSVLDLKSAKRVDYSWLEISMQLAIYARATHMYEWTGGAWVATPMPAVNRDRGLVAHTPIGKARAQLYGVNLLEGWASVAAAIDVRARRSNKTLAWLVEPDALGDVVRLHIDRADTLEALSGIAANATKRGVWTDDLAAHAWARSDVIRARTAQTRDELAALWAELHPAGRWSEPVSEAAQRRATELELTTV